MRDIFTGDCRRKLPVLGFSLLFFGILCFTFGVGIYPDSDTYLQMQAKREPLYPLFLHVCRNPVVSDNDTKFIGSSQCSLLYLYHEGTFLGKAYTGMAATGDNHSVALCFDAPCHDAPWLSLQHDSFQAILTEGLTYSFYLFFSVELIRGLLEEEEKDRGAAFLRGLFWVFLLLLLRSSDDDYLVHLGHCSRVCCIDTDKDRETENFCQWWNFGSSITGTSSQKLML